MIIGFTGTQDGMTEYQKELTKYLVILYCPTFAYHGGCVGADVNFDTIIHAWSPLTTVCVYPSNIKSKQGKLHIADYVYPELPPLVRNHYIVDKSDMLVATPKGFQEELRSGTWATIRYAKRRGKKVRIIYPSEIKVERQMVANNGEERDNG